MSEPQLRAAESSLGTAPPPDSSPTCVRHPDEGRWLAARRDVIGSSDGPEILGIGYRGVWSVYADKASDLPRSEPTWLMRRGKALEYALAEEFERQTGLSTHDPGDYALYRSAIEPWIACTPDRFVERGRAILEIKTVNWFQRHRWGDEPSEYALIQANHQLLVLGLNEWHIIAEIGADDPKCYRGERNERFLAAYVETLREFRQRILDRRPPEADGSEATREALARLYPQDKGLTISLPERFIALDERRQSLSADIKAMGEEKDLIDNQLRAEIGEASVGVLPNGVEYSWRQQERHDPPREARVSKFRVLRRKGG